MRIKFTYVLQGDFIVIDLGEQIVMGLEIIVSVALLLVGIAFLVMIHICIIGRVFRSRTAESGGQQAVIQRYSGPKVKGMSTEELMRLPCLEYEAVGEEGLSGPLDCAVCLDCFKVGDKCRLLPNCQHFFHAQCIDVWLRETPFCPVCRACAIQPRILAVPGGVSGAGVSGSFQGDELT